MAIVNSSLDLVAFQGCREMKLPLTWGVPDVLIRTVSSGFSLKEHPPRAFFPKLFSSAAKVSFR